MCIVCALCVSLAGLVRPARPSEDPSCLVRCMANCRPITMSPSNRYLKQDYYTNPRPLILEEHPAGVVGSVLETFNSYNYGHVISLFVCFQFVLSGLVRISSY